MSGSRTIHDISRVWLLCTCAAFGSQSLLALDPNRTLDQYITTRWGRDSFPGGTINAIAQTPDGYLWFGAAHGLVRFDGISFRLIGQGSSPALPFSPVLGLVVDAEGALWVRMQSPYLMRYRGGTFEQMYPAKIPPEFTFAREEGAAALSRGINGSALIATPGEPLRYADGKFTPIVSSGAVHGIPMSIAETTDGRVWVGMREAGLFCVRDGRGSQAGLKDQKVHVLLPTADARLWIGTDSGLVQWDGSAVTRRSVPDALATTPILALARDRNDNLWIATRSGIVRMNSSGTLATGGASPGVVHAIFEDREGNVWLGGTDGLVQLRDARFLSYSRVADAGGSLYTDTSGRVWIAPASGGLLWMRGADRQAVTAQGLDRDTVYSIAGGPGEVWVGRKRGGVTQLREGGGRIGFRSYTARDGLAPGVVCAVYRTRDGAVWAGTFTGAVSRIQKGRITTFTTADGLSGDAVTTIQEGNDGVIWVGTADGLQAFRDGKWRRYGIGDGLPPGRVNTLLLDTHGVLWIGSYSGLLYWSGKRVLSAQRTPALLEREIYGLAADGAGGLWAVTDSHLVAVSRAELVRKSENEAPLREFGMADGLPSTQGVRRDRSVLKDASGQIWFSLQGGVSVVNPLLPSDMVPAIVNVHSVAVDGRQLATTPVARYRSDGRRVVFSFVGVSLAVPGRVRYRYQLDGYDTDWSHSTDSREAAYTALPPGRYTFRVVASNSEGLWNGAPASVPLEVTPQLSEAWWVRAVGLSLTAAGIVAGLRYRLARVQAAMNLRFEERLAERTRIARELHDTLLQSFQALMLRLQAVDNLLPPGRAKEQLGQSLDRADEAIVEGRNAVYHLRSSSTRNEDLTEAVQTLAGELAAEDAPDFQLIIQGATRDLHPIVHDELYGIIREALGNAFRHAAADRIEAEITYGERTFRLCIRDDGKGIPAEMLKLGRLGHYGICGMRERAQVIGAKLEIWSGDRSGTEIEFSMPASVAYRSSAGASPSRLFRKKAG